jgi:two-component system, NtrC family, response regulator GlrR
MSRSSPSAKTRHLSVDASKTGKPHRPTPDQGDAKFAAKVLLVDDDPAVLSALARVLSAEGWQVITAANGEEALARLAEQQPDLMITDLCMAEVSGWDLLFHENLQRPGLPIFVITALPPTSIDGADRLAAEFFQKPLDLEVLVDAIRRRLGPKRPGPAQE